MHIHVHAKFYRHGNFLKGTEETGSQLSLELASPTPSAPPPAHVLALSLKQISTILKKRTTTVTVKQMEGFIDNAPVNT